MKELKVDQINISVVEFVNTEVVAICMLVLNDHTALTDILICKREDASYFIKYKHDGFKKICGFQEVFNLTEVNVHNFITTAVIKDYKQNVLQEII